MLNKLLLTNPLITPFFNKNVSFIFFVKYYVSKVSNIGECLLNVPIDSNSIGNYDFDKHLPGQIWTADDQCKMIYGPGASFCQVLYKTVQSVMYIFNCTRTRPVFDGHTFKTFYLVSACIILY